MEISTTTENTYNWLHQLVKDALGRETICRSPDGTLVKGTFEGLTCDEVCCTSTIFCLKIVVGLPNFFLAIYLLYDYNLRPNQKGGRTMTALSS